MIFLTLAAGYWAGNFKIGKFALGSVTGTLLAGVLIGQLGFEISPQVKTMFYTMFLFAVGYSVGPQFVQGVARDGLPQAIFGVVVSLLCLASVYVAAKIAGYDVGLAAGVLAGSRTISASIGLATSAINSSGVANPDALLNQIPVAYAITYLWGTVGTGIILSVLGPKLLNVDIAEECRKYEAQMSKGTPAGGMNTTWQQLQMRAYRRMMRVSARHHLRNLGVLFLLAFVLLLAAGDVTGWGGQLLLPIRARSAGVLLAVGQEAAVWPLLKHEPDPTLRTRLIHDLRPVMIGPQGLLNQLPKQDDVSLRRPLILMAWEMVGADDPQGLRGTPREVEPDRELIDSLLRLYLDDPDAGVHAAAGWTLRHYGQQSAVTRIDRELAAAASPAGRQWYVTRQGHTMAVIAGPAEFRMGSPPAEASRGNDEPLHPRRIARSFSLADRETTAE